MFLDKAEEENDDGEEDDDDEVGEGEGEEDEEVEDDQDAPNEDEADYLLQLANKSGQSNFVFETVELAFRMYTN